MSTADAHPANAPGGAPDDAALPSGAPDDAALPGVVLLQQPRRLVEVLSPLLAEWLDPGARLVDSRVAIRRYVPGKRCIVELELAFEAEDGRRTTDGVLLPPSASRLPPVEVRTVMGKFYAGEEGTQVYDTLHRLWASGFGTGPLTVPRPIAYEPDWRLLLVGQASGVVLQQLLLAYQATGDRRQEPGACLSPVACRLSPDVSTAIERSAGWLVKLHTSGVRGRRWYTFDRHLHTLKLWQGRLVDVYPEATSLLAAVLARIEARGRALSAWQAAPTHRDFSPDNVVLDGTQLSVLDFDEFCQYDPLFDVAHFVAHLRLLGLTSSGMVPRFDELATRFQMAYQAQAKEYSAARVRLYEAITYLKLAHVIACVTRPSSWQQSVAMLLHEAQRTV